MTGLYIHIPFCARKCLYCDFPSYANKAGSEDDYIRALVFEMEHYKGTRVDTVYIGGGTPSILSLKNLGKIFDAVHKNFTLIQPEITVEVNPASAIREKLECLISHGVNRLSIGVQSFHDKELEGLGRLHSGQDAVNTIETARSIGFQNINVDLMLAIPCQTPKSLQESLHILSAYEPEHISAYSLIVEPDTPFYNMSLTLPNEDEEREMYWLCADYLAECGYHHYEISNFARDGYQSHHNCKYWSGEDYIGIGCAAHSFQHSLRTSHSKDVASYIKSPLCTDEMIYIDESERIKERFLLGLRMLDGIEYHGEFPQIVEKLRKNGLVQQKGNRLSLSRHGVDLANQVFMEFI